MKGMFVVFIEAYNWTSKNCLKE